MDGSTVDCLLSVGMSYDDTTSGRAQNKPVLIKLFKQKQFLIRRLIFRYRNLFFYNLVDWWLNVVVASGMDLVPYMIHWVLCRVSL